MITKQQVNNYEWRQKYVKDCPYEKETVARRLYIDLVYVYRYYYEAEESFNRYATRLKDMEDTLAMFPVPKKKKVKKTTRK